jgi:ABC-type Fe3+ transport system permease subunit
MLITLRIAAAAAALSLFLVLLRTVCWPQTRVKMLNSTALFLFALPGSFLAAAWLALQITLEKKLEIASSQNLSLFFFVTAYVVRFMYVPLRLAEEGIASIDSAVLEAAANLGRDRFTRAITVELPLIAPYLVSSTGLVLIFCLGEVPIATALAPPGSVPATVWLFQQQHMGYDEAVFALSLLLGATAAGTLLFAGLAVKMLSRVTNRFRNGS